jgi:ribosomal protein L25 (general stress protein Ctc)
MITAMQELKDNSLFTEGEEYIQIVLKKTEWIELFEKEKEQIIQAHIDGFDHIVVDFKKQEYAEQYYNQTFNQNKS